MSDSALQRYAVVETRDLVESHRLIDREADAEVLVAPVRGGMVTDFRIGDDPILFIDRATLRDHAQNVRGGIPILFPFAGKLTGDSFPIDGDRLPMPQHGFARRMPWRIAGVDTQSGAAVSLSLEASDATLTMWPFRFRLSFTYSLRDGVLTIDQRFANQGDRPMPIHPGLHPYFQLEAPHKAAARAVTKATAAIDNLTGAQVAITGPIDFSKGEVNLQLLDHDAPTLVFQRAERPPLELTFDPAPPVVTLWTLPGRDFICIEPWTRAADAVNRGEALWIPPGGEHRQMFSIARRPPA